MKKNTHFIRSGLFVISFCFVFAFTCRAQSVYLDVRKLASKKETDTRFRSPHHSRVVTEATITLEINARNMAPTDESYQLEWYFIAETLDRKMRVIYDKGSEKIELTAGGNVILTKAAKPLKTSKIDFARWGSHEKGAKMEGYIVLVKKADAVIASKASSRSLEELVRDPEKLDELIKTTERMEKQREQQMQNQKFQPRRHPDSYHEFE